MRGTKRAAVVFAAAITVTVAQGATTDDENACVHQSDDIAITACTRLIKSGKYSGRTLAVYYMNRGTELKDKEDYDHALADYNQAIRLDPNLTDAFYGRCIVHRLRQEYDQALADCNQSISLAVPKTVLGSGDRTLSSSEARADYFRARGRVYRDKSDYDRAIADYNEAIRIYPNSSSYYFDRGYAYYRKRDYDRAITDYSEAVRLDPGSAGTFDRRGDAYQAKGDSDRAIADYSEAIRLDPKNATYLNDRCWTRATAGRELEQALDDCTQALRLSPSDSNLMDSRGLVFLRLGRLDDAISEYSAALKIDPKLAGSLAGRGFAELKKGDGTAGNADIAAAKALQADIVEKFAGYGVTVSATPPASAVPAKMLQSDADCAQAETHWKSVEALNTLAAYEDHLRRFPNCAFASLAKMKIEAMKK